MVNVFQCQKKILPRYKGLIRNKRKIVLALGLKISDKNKLFGQNNEISAQNREDMRSGIERRQFSYNGHIPERRSGKDRGAGLIKG